MERRYTLTSTHTTTVHSYNDPATPAAATPAVRAAESAAPRPACPTSHKSLARRAATFLFFLTALILSTPLRAQAPITLDNGKICIGFETRTLTLEEAENIVNDRIGTYDMANRWGNHYIDLWTYAYFDVNSFQRFLTTDEYGGLKWEVIRSSITFAFVMRNEDGTPNTTKEVARIAPQNNRDPYRGVTQPTISKRNNYFWLTPTFQDPRTDGAEVYIVAGAGEGTLDDKDDWDKAVEIVSGAEVDGSTRQYYKMKLFTVRFVWDKPQSFYVNYYNENNPYVSGGGGASSSSTVWNIQTTNENIQACNVTGRGDWVGASGLNPKVSACNPGCFQFLQGGVVVKTGMQASVTTSICPDPLAEATLKVTRYKSTEHSWDGGGNGSNALKYNCYLEYFNGSEWTGTTQIAASEGEADSGQPYFGTATGVLTNAVSTAANGALNAPFYIPAAWHNYNRDSLRLVVSLDPSAPTELPFKMYPDPHLKTTFTNNFGAWGNDVTVYKKTAGTGGAKDIITGISTESEVYGIPATKNRYGQKYTLKTYGDKSDVFKAAYTEDPFTVEEVTLWYAPDLTTSFEQQTSANTDDKEERTELTYITEEGYYYFRYKGIASENTCFFFTDTVQVKPIPVPKLIMTTGEDCVNKNGFSVEASNPNGQADGWEWVLGVPEEIVGGIPIGYEDPISASVTTPWVLIPCGENVNPDGVIFKPIGEKWMEDDDDDDEYAMALTFKVSNDGPKGRFAIETSSAYTRTLLSGAGGISCLETFDNGAAETSEDYELYNESQIGLWPEQNPENEAKMKFSIPYSPLHYFKNNVFYARYWVGEDTSAWGQVGVACGNEDYIAPAAIGVSASGCVTTNEIFDCSPFNGTNYEAEPGEDVTLYCYMNYAQDEFEASPGWPIKKGGKDLEDLKVTVYWQVKGSDGIWKTWHVTGFGSDDPGVVDLVETEYIYEEDSYPVQYLTITALRKNVTETEEHRVYAVFGTCLVDPNSETQGCDVIQGFVPSDDVITPYDKTTTISVGGALAVGKAGEAINQASISICDGDKIDLELTGATLSDVTSFKWQDSVSGVAGWRDVATTNQQKYLNVTPNMTDAQKIAGTKIYYRLSFESGEKERVTTLVEVTVRKSPKTHIGWENGVGSWCKPPTVGYCAGDAITVYALKEKHGSTKANLYTAADKPSKVTFTFEKLTTSEFTTLSSGLSATDVNATNNSRYRIVAKNEGNCPVYSDTATIKINPQVTATISDQTVCVGPNGKASVTLTVENNPLKSYTWGYKNGSTWVDETPGTNNTYTREYPVSGSASASASQTDMVRVSGYVVYPVNPSSYGLQDTIRCSYKNENIKVITNVCRAEFNLMDGDDRTTALEICPGDTVTLAWEPGETDNRFVHGTDSLFYKKETETTWTWLKPEKYSYKDVDDDDEGYMGTFLYLDSSVTNHMSGKYLFVASKKDVGSRSKEAKTLTVKNRSKITSLSVKISNVKEKSVCMGDAGPLQVSVQAEPFSSKYTYTWTKNGGPALGASATSSTYPILSSGTVNATHAGTYMVSAVLNEGCPSDPWVDSAKLIVTPLPTNPTIGQPTGTQALCTGGTTELIATVNYPTQDGVTYTYKWYTGTGTSTSSVKTVTPADPANVKLTFGPSGADVSTSSDFAARNYFLVIESTAGGCDNTTVKTNVTGASVSVAPCGNDDLTPTSVAVCPSATTPQTFSLKIAAAPTPAPTSVTWQESIDGSSWTTASGTTGGAITAGSDYTFTPSAIPAAGSTKQYRAVIVRGGNTTYKVASYQTYANPVKPVLTATATPAEVCEKASTTIKVTHDKTTDYDYTYSWTGPGSYTSTAEIFTLSGTNLTTAKNGTYTVNVVATAPASAGSCTVNADQATVNLTVNPAPTMPTITVADKTVCPGTSHTFHPTISTALDHTYTWIWRSGSSTGTKVQGPSTGMGTTETDYTVPGSTATNTTPSNRTLTYNVMVKVNTAKSCTDSINKNVTLTVRPKPEVDTYTISLTPASACEGDVVSNGMSAKASATASAGTNFTYIWYDKDGTAVNTTTTTTHKFIPNGTTIALSHEGNYGVRVAVEDNDGCRSDTMALKTAKFTVNPLPAKPTIGALANGVICSNQSYTFTPTVEVDNTADNHTYTWYYSQTTTDPNNTGGYMSFTGKDLKICERALASTCNGAGIGQNANTLKARLYVKSTKGTCSRTEEGPVVTYTVSNAPTGNLVAAHTPITACNSSDTTLEVNLTEATNVTTQIFTWKEGATDLSNNAATYKVLAGKAAGSYTYNIADTLKNADGCKIVKTTTINLTVTKPTDLSNIKVDGAKTDRCTKDAQIKLSVIGHAQGTPPQALTHKWYKVGDESTILATTAEYPVPKAINSNGRYYCKVTAPATSGNPCSTENSTDTVDVAYQLCLEEVIEKNTSTNQNDALAIICQRGNENSPAAVKYEKPATDQEPDLITQVSWYKWEGSTAPAKTDLPTLSTSLTPIKVVSSISWPLLLTQQEVFAGVAAPKSYYVWVKVERGSVVTYSNTYRFVKAENAPKITAQMEEDAKTVCQGTAFSFKVLATPPAAPGNTVYNFTTAPTSEALKYIWTTPTTTATNSSQTLGADVGAPVTGATYSAKVITAYKYTMSGLTNTCYDTSDAVTGTLTVDAPSAVTLSINPGAAVCADAIPSGITLSATGVTGTITKWERSAPTPAAELSTSSAGTYTLDPANDDDIKKPDPGAASAVTNKYTVTVKNGVCPAKTSTEVSLTVNPIPDLDTVVITEGTTYCNNVSHSLTATPKKKGGGSVSGTVTYQWQEDNGTGWKNVGSNSSTYSIIATKDAGTYRYRCTATMGEGCPVTKTSAVQEFKIDDNTVPGSLTVDNSGVCSSATTNLPKVTLSGNTGSLKTLTFACGTNTVTKTDPDATSPYTLTTAELATLLNGTTGRELTVAVNATVQSGSCNAEAPNPANFKVYKPVPDIELTEADKVWCNLSSGSPKVNLKQAGGAALVLTSVEKIKWEKVGTASSVATAPATMNLIENNSTALYKDLSSSNYPSPKRDADTVYWFRATISSPGGCSDTKTATIKQTVLRQPVKPTLVSAPTEVCEGSPYTISAKRPGASDLVWKEVVSGTENAITSGTSYNNTTGAEELTVGAAVTGTHTYKVYDKRPQQGTCPELLSASLDISVTVNQKPVAGQIEASAGGVFCSGESVVVKHKSGTTLVAPTNKINWQVCTDTSNYPASKVDKERPNAEASVNYSASGFAAGTYFVRYVVPANGECQAVQSKWVGVTVINAVSVPAVSPLGTVCEGTEVTLSFTASEGLKYEIFANTATGSPLETITTAGPVNHKITAVPSTTDNRSTRDYFVKVTNTSYVGGGNCGTATSPAITLTVDAKPVGGTLLFANNSKDTLTANVADHAYLQLSGAKGNPLKAFSSTQPQGGSYGSATDIGAISTSANKDVPLQVSHMEKTMFWVVAQNGVCPDANSDTVVVTVKSANDPTLGITSPICEVITDATLTINVPETLKGTFQWTAVEWFRRTYTAGMGDGDGWYPITTVNDVSGTTGAPTTVTTTDPGARTLSPGTYQYRYSYVYGTGTSGYSNPATLQVDATSKGGALTVDPVAKVCQDGASPKLKLTGDVVGSIVANSLKKGTTSTAINSAVAGGSTDPTSVYSVPTGSDNLGVHYYQVQVKNGVCPADTSCSVAVEVIQKPVAGTLTVANTLCYDQGTTTVTLGNDKVGTSIKWSTATSQSGSYSPVAANDDQTTYTVGPLTDRLWVQVTVNTDEVCTAVSTTAEVKVYDTLTITTQPQDKTVVGSGSASFTVAASTAGIPYLDGSGDKHVAVSAGSYKWYHSTDNGTTWSAVNDDGDYSGATTVTLTVANAQNHPNEMFYCVVKDDKCSRPVTSNSAKIVAMDELNPGKTNSLTQCACYYPSDPALYYVEGAAGQGNLYYRWRVSTKYPDDPPTSDDHWQDITDFDLDYTPSAQGDSIVFTAVGTVMAKGIYWIRALVHDDYTSDWQSAESNLIKVCKQDKPTYTFKGDIVCERESGDEREFKYTAVPNHIDGRSIKYGYALPSDPTNFTEINIPNGTDATTDVKFGEGENEKTLRFIVKAADSSLVIPASSAIPFEADSMVIRMEVRSCYTPAPLATNTDTTIYVLLRVDAPVQITARAQDTIICKGSSFNMETGYGLLNKTIAGNEVTAKWYKTGTTGEQDSKTYPGNADGTAVHAFENLTEADAGTWFVNLSTKLCPVKTDTITVTVQNTPVIASVDAPADVCAGSEITLTATVNETASPAPYKITWERKDRDGQWRDVLGDAWTATDSIATSEENGTGTQKLHKLVLKKGSPADAGLYRAVLTITGGNCVNSADPEEVGVKINMKPVFDRLSKSPYVSLTVGNPASVTVYYKTASELATLYNVADAYLEVKTPDSYEWSLKGPEDADYTTTTNPAFSDLVQDGGTEATITLKGVDGFSGTWFKAKMTNTCGSSESSVDTLVISDKFAISDPEITAQPACQGDTVKIEISTNAPALSVQWHYLSTESNATWKPLVWPNAQYDSVWNKADNTYTLSIYNVNANMEGWKYRAVACDETNSCDTTMREDKFGTLGVDVTLHVDKPVKFICADDVFKAEDKQKAVAVGGSPDFSMFVPKYECLEGCTNDDCTSEEHVCEWNYVYELRKPKSDGYQQVENTDTYKFEPTASDTGMNYILFRVENHCGADTVYDSVLVIMKPELETVTGISTLKPGAEPNAPDNRKVTSEDNIRVEVCEGNTLYLAATYTGGPASRFRWQVDGADIPMPMSSPYSLRNDTLVISPVPDNVHDKAYQCVFEMPGNVPPITSKTITVQVNHKPSVADVKVEITDITHTDEDLESGQALPEGTVVLSVPNAPDYTKICFYQAFVHEEGEEEDIHIVVDSVKQLDCVEGPDATYTLTDNATVEEHDNTWYYAQIYNECGYDSTMPYQLRVFEDLKVVWIPDTIIPRPSGGWDYTTYSDPEPGDLVILYLPGEKPDEIVQTEAHLWVCQDGEFLVYDTTLTGFMNSQTGDRKEDMEPDHANYHKSRWYFRAPGGDWDVFSPLVDPWFDLNAEDGARIFWRVQEHTGRIGFTMPKGFDVDGYEFRAVGENARYSDTTCVLTLHVIPSIQTGDLKMTPPQITACNEADAEFKVTSETVDLSKLTIDWQVKPAGSDTWSDNIDLHNDTYTIGKVDLSYNGYEVRAIVQGACGSDTAYGKIVINTPVAPGVKLTGDSVCLGESLMLTAVDTGQAGYSKFEWYVNGDLVANATGKTFDLSAYPAGQYTVRVVMTADLTSNDRCVIPETAQAEEVAIIYALPQIKADIHDTIMKNIDTTSVWVKGQGDYTYAWTPETGLLDATSDSTLLWGLEAREEPHVYVVTATDEHGCQAKDSVEVIIESNFTIDSLSIVTIVPPVLDLDGGTLPGYPSEPEDSYYPELGGTPFGGELMFRNDTIADLWICAHNTALIHFYVRGGEKPITYNWTIDEGNATLVYPADAEEGSVYSFAEPDSVFGIFFPDTTTHTMRCEILDKTGVGGAITVNVHYYRPEMFYLEVTPKVSSGKYYEQQAMNFFVRPDRDWLVTWVDMRNGVMKDTVTNRKMNRQMSFTKEEGDETSIWISTVDRHGCRIWDSVPIHIIPLPNVLLVGDPKNGVLFPEFEVEVTNTWGLKIKGFEERNGNGSSRGWDGRTKSGTYVSAGTYYYRVKIPTLDKQGYMIVNGAVTVVNK